MDLLACVAMIYRKAVAVLIPLSLLAAAQEPQPVAEPAPPAAESPAPEAPTAEAIDWKAEEEAVLQAAAARGITPDRKAAAVAMANEQHQHNG